MSKKPKVATLETQNRLRSMSVERFAEKVDGNLLRSGVINTVFSREKTPLLFRRLENPDGSFDLKDEKRFQDEYVAQFASKLAEQQTILGVCWRNENLAVEEFLKAKEALENARGKLNSAKKATNHAQDAVADCEAIYQRELERRQRMDKIVLVHVSATLVQLEKYGDYKMVVSHVDEPKLRSLGIVDEVFDKKKAELIGIETDYSNLYASTTELRSKVAYVRMAAWHMLNDIPFELAYADKTIDGLLKHNGII